MWSVPAPLLPTESVPLLVNVDPAPLIVSVPAEPRFWPSDTFFAVAPAAAICAVPPLLISASVAALGRPLSQLPAVNQLPVASVQIVVWAKIVTLENASAAAQIAIAFLSGFDFITFSLVNMAVSLATRAPLKKISGKMSSAKSKTAPQPLARQ